MNIVFLVYRFSRWDFSDAQPYYKSVTGSDEKKELLCNNSFTGIHF